MSGVTPNTRLVKIHRTVLERGNTPSLTVLVLTKEQIDRFLKEARIFFPEEKEIIEGVDVTRKVHLIKVRSLPVTMSLEKGIPKRYECKSLT